MGALSEVALRRWSLGRFGSGRRSRQALKEICMKKTLTALTAAAMIAGTLAATATDASAQRLHVYGWAPGAVIGGIIAGTVIACAILASRPRGYVVYERYGQPIYIPGSYWASQPI